MTKALTDHEIVLQIQEWLDGVEWTCDTLPEIAELLAYNGYEVAGTKEDLETLTCAEVKAAHAADGAPLGGNAAIPHPNTDECTAACNNAVPEEPDDILAYLKMPLQVRTIDGVDVQYHPSQPIDYLLEEAAKEIERCRSMLSECADFIESCADEIDDPAGATTFARNIRAMVRS